MKSAAGRGVRGDSNASAIRLLSDAGGKEYRPEARQGLKQNKAGPPADLPDLSDLLLDLAYDARPTLLKPWATRPGLSGWFRWWPVSRQPSPFSSM